jgi:hypothetical protein
MDFFIQYHNVETEGLILSDPPFSATRRYASPPARLTAGQTAAVNQIAPAKRRRCGRRFQFSRRHSALRFGTQRGSALVVADGSA